MTMATSSSITGEGPDPMDLLMEKLAELKLRRSINPISYSSDEAPLPTISSSTASPPSHKKVSIIGCGQVGLAAAYAMLNQETAGSICLVDMDGEKLEGEAKDLRQGSAFHERIRIEASTAYGITANSHLVVITAGVAQKVGESRLSLVKRNVVIMKSIIPMVLDHSPNAAICIVANPCDIMTAVAAKAAGPSVPPGRIFGSGTCLDSSRLRSVIAKVLDVDTNSVHGYIIGEHGDSSVPVWSSVRVGGVPILEALEEPNEMHHSIHREVVDSAGDVIKRKGYTNWAVGLTAAHIAKVVLSDAKRILPVSTCVRGLYGVEEDVFLSLPCTVGAKGVVKVVDLPLTAAEKEHFVNSAQKVWEVQKDSWDTI